MFPLGSSPSGAGSGAPLGPLILAGLAVWISSILVVWIWVKHRDVSTPRKLLWTLVVMIPPLGWMLFWGFFRPPGRTGYETPDSITHSGTD